MDRITYLSTAQPGLSKTEIQEIGRVSKQNNARDGLTGILLCYRGIFYQSIEGESQPLEHCLRRIRADSRHTDIVILKMEKNIAQRKYPDWKMRTLILEEHQDPLLAPIEDLLDLMSRSYSVIEKYVPIEVLEGIQQGGDPVTWELKRSQHIVMFVDLVGFSTMIEKISDLHDLRSVIDAFYSSASQAIGSTGGKISKLLGDGFMAYYGMDQANQALQGATCIIKELSDLRANASSPFAKLLFCGIGISAGPVVKGNVGSGLKKDFTLLGDVVNSASRLESSTRRLGYTILMDQRFKKLLKKAATTTWKLKKLGKFKMKGKSSKLMVYTIDLPEIKFQMSAKQIARKINEI